MTLPYNSLLMDKIADELQSNGIGTVDTDIFIGQLPQEVEQGMFLVEVPGNPPNMWVDTEEPVIDFWMRSDHTAAAYKKLRDVYNLYHRRANYPLGDWYIYFSHALTNVQDMDRERESGKLFKVSILFECRNINNVS